MTRSLSQEIAPSDEDSNISLTDEVELDITVIEEEVTEEASKILTTVEEIEAFEKIKAIAETATNYKYEVKYKDTISYFGINLGKTKWWFLRFYLSSHKKTFIARLSADEVKSLAPDFNVQEVPTSPGEVASKITISSLSDLDKLVPVILRCYELEASKH
jgi:predicted type IV restriction endonuclease